MNLDQTLIRMLPTTLLNAELRERSSIGPNMRGDSLHEEIIGELKQLVIEFEMDVRGKPDDPSVDQLMLNRARHIIEWLDAQQQPF